MALGQFDLAATTETLIYTVPADTEATATVVFTARTQQADIKLAKTTGGAPAAKDFLVDGFTLNQGDSYTWSGVFLIAAERLYAEASATGVSVNVFGPEEAA